MTRAVGAAVLVVNPAAGTAEDESVETARAALDSAGGLVEVVRPGGVPEFRGAVLDAAAGGARVVVAGGDGTIHLAVQALWDAGLASDTPVGLVPLGTGNDLATGLGLPMDPGEAALACVHGVPRTLDLVLMSTGGVVVNASHAGLGASAAERSAGLKDKLGPLAYPVGALIAGVREAAWTLEVVLDGDEVHAGDTLMVGIANGPSIGGGTRIVPPALPDDGLLDVIVVTAVGPAARLAFGAALRNEAHLDRPDVLHLRGRQVTISGDPVVHDVDGELTEELATCTYTVQPGAWQLLRRSA